MVKSSISATAAVACAVIGATVATHYDGVVGLAARDLTTITVTATTCPEAGSSYPPGSVASSGPVETPATPYGSPPATTSAEIPPPYSAPSVTTSVKTSSAVIPPAVPTTSESATVKTESTPTTVATTPATSSIESSTSSTHSSATPSTSHSIPPAVGVAGKIKIHAGALVAVAIGAVGALI